MTSDSLRQRIEQLIQHEEQFHREVPGWEITVFVPEEAGEEFHEKLFDQLADFIVEVEPEDRMWDLMLVSRKNSHVVPSHFLRRALDQTSEESK